MSAFQVFWLVTACSMVMVAIGFTVYKFVDTSQQRKKAHNIQTDMESVPFYQDITQDQIEDIPIDCEQM